MSEIKKELDIDDWEFWWDTKRFIRTLIVCGLIYAGLMLWFEHIKPPVGYVFVRMPPITGEWWSGHCGNGHTCATVGNTPINCSVAGYFPFGGGGIGLCGHLNIPNGEVVTAIRVLIPLMNNDSDPYLAVITSDTKSYQFETDAQILNMWLKNSREDVSSIFIQLFIIIYFIELAVRNTPKE